MIDIQKIKRSRLPEAFFIEMLEGMVISERVKCNDWIYYEFNGITILIKETRFNWLYVNYDKIWKVMEMKKGGTRAEIQSYIKKVVEKHTDINGFEPMEYQF